jgi:hypothetical protein
MPFNASYFHFTKPLQQLTGYGTGKRAVRKKKVFTLRVLVGFCWPNLTSHAIIEIGS